MKIAVIPGDGIGPEVIQQALGVLNKISEVYGISFEFTETLMGGNAYDETGTPLPEETVKTCLASDSVLLGAVGGPKWDDLSRELRPEAGLLGLRKVLGVFANLRPAILFPQLIDASSIKAEVLGNDLDLMVVRELTGGIYFGKKGKEKIDSGYHSYDVMSYTSEEIKRVARVAFQVAGQRNKKLTMVDKSNVLESSRLWREEVEKISLEFPEIELKYLYVDNAAMQLIRNPRQFDVILTGNMFGDILSDAAAMLTGSLGMLPSASINGTGPGLYEPIHGSAPDIAGKDMANPIATIMSCSMMLKYAFQKDDAAKSIEDAVKSVLEEGYRTGDIAQKDKMVVSCSEMGGRIIEKIK